MTPDPNPNGNPNPNPNPNQVAEQLQIYQDNLSEKQKQLKAMTAELNMHRGQVSDLKLDQENLVSQLGQVKKKYFSRKQQERRQQVMYGNYMEPPPQGTAEYGFGGEGEPPGAAGSGGGDAGGGGGDAALGADPGAQ